MYLVFLELPLTVCKQAYAANFQHYCQGATLSGSYACLLLATGQCFIQFYYCTTIFAYPY